MAEWCPVKVVRSEAMFPKHLRGAEYLVSVQRSSPCADPEDAVREFVEAIRVGEMPEIHVVRFGDGFRWTYRVEDDG